MPQALKTFAAQAHMQLLYQYNAVMNAKGNAVIGELDKHAALDQLLKDSGLEVIYSSDSAATIRPRLAPTSNLRSDDQNSGAGASSQPSGDSLQLAQATPGQSTGDLSVEESETKSKRKPENEVLQEVVVTGTHIRGVAPVGTTTSTLDRKEIEQSGYTTTQELLASLPQNFGGGAAGASADANFQSSTYSASNNGYGSGVNLRGLGNTATLILVNGHRVASSGNGYFTDVSTIPLSAIDHIDVLADGASAIYGSDAVAGVVNIVLKSETQGVEAGLRYGHTTDRGFPNEGANLEVGHGWEGGGFTLGADYSHQGILDASQRRFTDSVPSPTTIFPSFNQTALTGAAHEALGDLLEIHGDAQYTHST
ncbi:MAG: TonB-dependent receptor plug domain-containing protein, partial [Terriglobales bacterium]